MHACTSARPISAGVEKMAVQSSTCICDEYRDGVHAKSKVLCRSNQLIGGHSVCTAPIDVGVCAAGYSTCTRTKKPDHVKKGKKDKKAGKKGNEKGKKGKGAHVPLQVCMRQSASHKFPLIVETGRPHEQLELTCMHECAHA